MVKKTGRPASKASRLFFRNLFSPEAASGGNIAYIKDGDIMKFDIAQRTIDIVGCEGKRMTPEEVSAVFEARKKVMPLKPLGERNGVFKKYTEHARSAMQGAGI